MKAPQKIGTLLSIGLVLYFCSFQAFGEGVPFSWKTYNPLKDPSYNNKPRTGQTTSWDLILKLTQDYERAYSSDSRQSSQPRAEHQPADYLSKSAGPQSYSSVDMASAGYLNYYGFYQGRYNPGYYSYTWNSPRLFWWSLIPLMNWDKFQDHNSNHHH